MDKNVLNSIESFIDLGSFRFFNYLIRFNLRWRLFPSRVLLIVVRAISFTMENEKFNRIILKFL
jgi:hypothetical protein